MLNLRLLCLLLWCSILSRAIELKNALATGKLLANDEGILAFNQSYLDKKLDRRTRISRSSCPPQWEYLLRRYILPEILQWADDANEYIFDAEFNYILRRTIGTTSSGRRRAVARDFRLLAHEIRSVGRGTIMIHCDWQNVICPHERREYTRSVTFGGSNSIVLVHSFIVDIRLPC